MNMAKLYVGVDLSLTSPGIACLNEDGSIRWLRFFAHKAKHEGKITDQIEGIVYPIYGSDSERYWKLGNAIAKLIFDEIAAGNDVKVALEGYSFGSTGSRLFQIAENGGVFKLLLWQKGIDLKIVAPSAVKKLACNKGNGKKEDVYAAFVNKYGIDLQTIFGSKSAKIGSPVSDLADATFMAEWRRREDDGNVDRPTQ